MGREAVPWLLTQGQALALALGVYFLTYLEAVNSHGQGFLYGAARTFGVDGPNEAYDEIVSFFDPAGLG